MKDYKKLEEEMKIRFKDKKLLDNAFVHKSYMNEHRREQKDDNERLEFLGDAVLELVATKHLFEKHPEKSEGEMTSYRSALVKGDSLAEVARRLKLGEYLYLSHGEDLSGGREKNYILANTVEALIGAIYLDRGHEAAEKFIGDFIMAKLDEIVEKGLHIDAKSYFQEICQEKKNVTPYYDVIKEVGPDHDKVFTMGAFIEEELIASGEGSSKQKAENEAAKNALTKMGW